MKPRAKRIEAVRAWTCEYADGALFPGAESGKNVFLNEPVPVVILRAADWKRVCARLRILDAYQRGLGPSYAAGRPTARDMEAAYARRFERAAAPKRGGK